VTLSRWEYDKVYPTWPHQPKLIAYLGFDPFTDPALGSPKGNETYGVAFLSSKAAWNLSHQITRHRLQMKKNRKQFAKELGICPKTIWGWETGRCKPSAPLRARILVLLNREML